MRPFGLALLIAVLILGLSWLFGPHSPAPPLPPSVLGSDTAWLAQAQRISQQRRLLSVTSLVLTPIWLWLPIRFGWSATLRTWLQQHGFTNPWLLVAAYTLIFLVATELLNGPLNYAGLALRRGYGLSQESTSAWLIRQSKQFLVAAVLTLVTVEGVYWLLRVAPQRWWIIAAGGFAVFSLMLTYLQPYVITPLFFTQRPLEDQALRTRIFQLGERVGVPIREMYVIDASAQGNEGNAYFTGIGGATRIVIYDTLLRDYPQDELLTILAHEFGHWRAQHVWKGLLLSWTLAPLGLWIVHLLMGGILPNWGIQNRSDIAGLPLLLLIVTLGGLLGQPAQNWLSRRWERTADQFALAATRDPAAFQATFVRLARQNLTDPTPPPIVEGFWGTHPAVGRRIAEAQSLLLP